MDSILPQDPFPINLKNMDSIKFKSSSNLYNKNNNFKDDNDDDSDDNSDSENSYYSSESGDENETNNTTNKSHTKDDQSIITFDPGVSDQSDSENEHDKKDKVTIPSESTVITSKITIKDVVDDILSKKMKKIEVQKQGAKKTEKKDFIIPIPESDVKVSEDKTFKQLLKSLKKKIPDENMGQLVISQLQSFINRIHDPLYVFLQKVAFNLGETDINRFIKLFSNDSEEKLLESLIELEKGLGRGPFTTKQMIGFTTQTIKTLKKAKTFIDPSLKTTKKTKEIIGTPKKLLDQLSKMGNEIGKIKDQLSSQFFQLESRAKKLDDELATLKKKRVKTTRDNDQSQDLLNKINRLNSIINRLNNKLKTISDDNLKLKKNFNKERDDKLDLKNLNKIVINQKESAIKKQDELNDQIKQLEKQLIITQQSIKDRNDRIDNLKKNNTVDQKELDILTSEKKDLVNNNNELEKKLNKSSNELLILRKENSNLLNQVNDLKGDLFRYINMLNNRGVFKGLKTLLPVNERRIDILIKSTDDILKTAQQLFTRQVDELTDSLNKIKDQNITINDLRIANEELIEMSDRLKKDIENRNERIRELSKQIEKVASERNVLKNNGIILQKKLNLSKKRIKVVNNKFKFILNKVPNLNNIRTMLQNVLNTTFNNELIIDKTRHQSIIDNTLDSAINTIIKSDPEGTLSQFSNDLTHLSIRLLMKSIGVDKGFDKIIAGTESYKRAVRDGKKNGALDKILGGLSNISGSSKKINFETIESWFKNPVTLFIDTPWETIGSRITYDASELIVETLVMKTMDNILKSASGFKYDSEKDNYKITIGVYGGLISNMKSIPDFYDGLLVGSNDNRFKLVVGSAPTFLEAGYALITGETISKKKRKIDPIAKKKKINSSLLSEFFDEENPLLLFNNNAPETTMKINHYLEKMHHPEFDENHHLQQIHERWFNDKPGDIGATSNVKMEDDTGAQVKKTLNISEKLRTQEEKLIKKKNELTDLWLNDINNHDILSKINQLQQMINNVKSQMIQERTRENIDRLRLLRQLRVESQPDHLRMIILDDWFLNVLEETGNRVINLSRKTTNVKGQPKLSSYIHHETLRDHYAKYVATYIKIPEAEKAIIKKRAPRSYVKELKEEKLLLEELVFSRVVFIGKNPSKPTISELQFDESKFIQSDIREKRLLEFPQLFSRGHSGSKRKRCIKQEVMELYKDVLPPGTTTNDFDQIHLVKKPKKTHIMTHIKKEHLNKKERKKELYNDPSFLSLY